MRYLLQVPKALFKQKNSRTHLGIVLESAIFMYWGRCNQDYRCDACMLHVRNYVVQVLLELLHWHVLPCTATVRVYDVMYTVCRLGVYAPSFVSCGQGSYRSNMALQTLLKLHMQ